MNTFGVGELYRMDKRQVCSMMCLIDILIIYE